MNKYKDDFIVGCLSSNEPIQFKHLNIDIQIELQNSNRWEDWKNRSLKLLDELEELKSKLSSFEKSNQLLTIALKNASDKIVKYEEALEFIRGNVDSLEWAKHEAQRVYEQFNLDPG